MISKKRNTTNNGRVVLKVKKKEIIISTKRAEEIIVIDEEPKCATSNWQLWKLCQTISLEEIKVLISKRSNDLKYETNLKKRNELKLDILLLEDAYRIMKRR